MNEEQLSLAARVVNRDQEPIGHLHEVVVERESQRIAGLHIISDEIAPRELFVMIGQVAAFTTDEITLALTDEEFVALPDARQQIFVTPEQDLDEEIADAEADTASPSTPDPDEHPVLSELPGIALTPNLLIPIAVERSIMDEAQIALRHGMRLLTGDGEEIGYLGGILVDPEARLQALVLNNLDADTVDAHLIGAIDDDANELFLLPNDLHETVTAEED